MLSMNTGHGVRTTHRKNVAIRPPNPAVLATSQPYLPDGHNRGMNVLRHRPSMAAATGRVGADRYCGR
jgi:hypothetical protein